MVTLNHNSLPKGGWGGGTEKAATYKIQEDPSTKRDNISADGATQCATKQQLNAHHDRKKKNVYINQYPNNHHHHIQSHTLDKTQEQNHKKGQI